MRNFASIPFFILGVSALFFLVVGSTIIRAADGNHPPELLLAAGMACVWLTSLTEGWFLANDDMVVSFTHGGETRAYPLRILVWHEIVNDP